MSSYVYRPGHSYKAYLQEKSFIDDIRWDISKTNLNLVATKDALEKHGVRVEESLSRGFDKTTESLERVQEITREGFVEIAGRLEEVDRTLGEGFVTLHSDLLHIEGSVKDLSAKFDWGIIKLEMAIGGVRDSLDDLLRLARSPEQTWAYEQFDLARVALHRKLIPESLEHVDRAINGFQTHPGNRLEFRFHHLLGTLHGSCIEAYDPDKASQAYLNAARYAETDDKKDAALALLAAGRIAYGQGDIIEAEGRTSRSLALAESPEGNYQLAKIIIHQHRVDEALTYFVKALRHDPLYSVRCLDDGDFLAYKREVIDVTNGERDRLLVDCKRCTIMVGQEAKAAHTALIPMNQIFSSLPDPCIQSFRQYSTALAALATEVEAVNAHLSWTSQPYLEVYDLSSTIGKWPAQLATNMTQILNLLEMGIKFIRENPSKPTAPPMIDMEIPEFFVSGFFTEMFCRIVVFVGGLTIIAIFAVADSGGGAVIGGLIALSAWYSGELFAEYIQTWINNSRTARVNNENTRKTRENLRNHNRELLSAKEKSERIGSELLALHKELEMQVTRIKGQNTLAVFSLP